MAGQDPGARSAPCRHALPARLMREADMSNRHNPSSLDAAITSYLTSKYFTELAPGTQRMRRNLLKNICAEVRRLSAAEISEALGRAPGFRPDDFFVRMRC